MTWEQEIRLSARRALAMHQFADILGIFTRARRSCTRPAGDRLETLRQRILRDGWLPNAFQLGREFNLVPKTFHRDLAYLKRSLPIDFDPIKNIYVLKESTR